MSDLERRIRAVVAERDALRAQNAALVVLLAECRSYLPDPNEVPPDEQPYEIAIRVDAALAQAKGE